MAEPGRKAGGARATGPLAGRATAGLGARGTVPLPATPPGWLAPAIAACGLLGAALGAFGLVWHQTRLDLPGAAYVPRRAPSVAEDAWPLYREADRALRFPSPLEAEAIAHFRAADPKARAEKPFETRRGMLVGAREKTPHDWLPAYVAANPGPLATLREARARPGFRVVGADPLTPVARWEDFRGLGALAVAAVRTGAADRPDAALGHLADGLALGARLLHGGGALDWDAGLRVLAGMGEAGEREWPHLARASDAALAAFARDLDAIVPSGDAGAWLLRGGLDQSWRDVPAHAHGWRVRMEADDAAFAVLFARPLAALETPRATRLVRGVLADVAGKVLADRKRGKVSRASAYPLVPFLSATWQLVLVYGAAGDTSPAGVMRVAGVGAVSVVLHPEEWAAYMLASSLAEALTAETDEAFRALARLDGLRVRAALERRRRAGGAPPARLEALVPGSLRALPRDPFAPNRPYRWTAGRLRSVGPDGKPGTKDDLAL